MSILSNFTAYVKQVWANRPSLTSPLSATRFNYMEAGIKANSDAIEQIANAVLSNIVNDPNKIASMAVAYSLQEQVNKLNSEMGTKIKSREWSDGVQIAELSCDGRILYIYLNDGTYRYAQISGY